MSDFITRIFPIIEGDGDGVVVDAGTVRITEGDAGAATRVTEGDAGTLDRVTE